MYVCSYVGASIHVYANVSYTHVCMFLNKFQVIGGKMEILLRVCQKNRRKNNDGCKKMLQKLKNDNNKEKRNKR